MGLSGSRPAAVMMARFFGRNREILSGGAALFDDGRNETIAPPYDGLQVLGFAGVIRQGLPNFADCGIDALVHVNKHVLTPELAGDLFTRDELAFVFD